MAKPKTPLQDAIAAYIALHNVAQKAARAEDVLNKRVEKLSTDDAQRYMAATTAFDKKNAENLERIEKMHTSAQAVRPEDQAIAQVTPEGSEHAEANPLAS